MWPGVSEELPVALSGAINWQGVKGQCQEAKETLKGPGEPQTWAPGDMSFKPVLFSLPCVPWPSAWPWNSSGSWGAHLLHPGAGWVQAAWFVDEAFPEFEGPGFSSWLCHFSHVTLTVYSSSLNLSFSRLRENPEDPIKEHLSSSREGGLLTRCSDC